MTTTTTKKTRPARQAKASQQARKPRGATAAEVRAAQAARLAAKPERKTSGPRGPREGSTLSAILIVLGDAKDPMNPADVYAEIKRRKLAPGLKGKTPIATVGARMATAHATGGAIKRVKPGLYALAS